MLALGRQRSLRTRFREAFAHTYEEDWEVDPDFDQDAEPEQEHWEDEHTGTSFAWSDICLV